MDVPDIRTASAKNKRGCDIRIRTFFGCGADFIYRENENYGDFQHGILRNFSRFVQLMIFVRKKCIFFSFYYTIKLIFFVFSILAAKKKASKQMEKKTLKSLQKT